MDQALMA